MAEIMHDAVEEVSSQGMEKSRRVSEAGASSLSLAPSPKAPLRSISYSNLRGNGLGSITPGKRASVVEEMETRQRENMSRKLKDLQRNGGRTPKDKDKVDMPTIVDSRPAKHAVLPRSALRRDNTATYQAVTPAAFSLKGVASPGAPNFSLKGPEFPLRASQSLTSLNHVYDRGLSVFASDDFDNYSAGKEFSGNKLAAGNVTQAPSLSSSVCVEFQADAPVQEAKLPEDKVAENWTDSRREIKSTSDKQKSKQTVSLISGISPTAEPPLKLKTFPKPEIPAKPADFKMFTSKAKTSRVGNAEFMSLAPEVGSHYVNHVQATVTHDATEQNGSKAALIPVPVEVSAPATSSHQIPSYFNHSRSSVGVDKEITLTEEQRLQVPEKIDHHAKNYYNADIKHRSHNHLEGDENHQETKLVPQPPKPSFETRLQVEVNTCDLVIHRMPVPEESEFTTGAPSRMAAVPGYSMGLHSNANPYFVSHQKMDSFLSDCNTVDSGIGRSEVTGSPYQDSADDLDNRCYAGWTASTAVRSTEGRFNQQLQQQQQLKRQTKNEFVTTAAMSLSRQVTGTSTVNDINARPASQDTSLSPKHSNHQESLLPASPLRGTMAETSCHRQETQRMSVLSKPSYSSYSSSTSLTQSNLGFSTLDVQAPVETETRVRVSGSRYPREDGVSRSNFDVQSNQKKLSEHRKTTMRNLDSDRSKSPHSSASRHTMSWGSEVTEVQREGEGQSPRDLHRNETRVGNETQWNRNNSRFLDGTEKKTETRTETRTEVSQANAFNKKNEDQFNRNPYRTGTRTEVRQIPEVKNEKQVSRDPEYTESTQLRKTFTSLSGFEPRRQSVGIKKEDQIVVCGDDGMIEIKVQLIKGSIGLGFCIEGGIGSPLGDRPVTVKRLFKGESAAKGKLEPGDVIVSINGQPISNKSHYQAWNHLKSLPEGPINLVIHRRPPLPTATLV